MSLFPWKTHDGQTVQDHTPQDIIFKKTAAQVTAKFIISPSLTVSKPMGQVQINSTLTIAPFPSIKYFLSSRLLASLKINTAANSRVSKWKTIMFKYIGDRTVGN